MRLHEAAPADEHLGSLHHDGRTQADPALPLATGWDQNAASGGVSDDGAGHGMADVALGGGRKPKDPFGWKARVEARDAADVRNAPRERARLVEYHRVDPGQALEEAWALEQDALVRPTPDRDHRRRRDRDAHGLPVVRDEDRDAGVETSSRQGARAREQEGAADEPVGKCLAKHLELRLLALGGLDRADDLTEPRVRTDLLVRTAISPSSTVVPARTLSRARRSTGRLSPVIVCWSTRASPRTTRPSTGIRSPGPTRMTCPV